MDINILLGLQEFRNMAGACLVSFMSKMSYIGEIAIFASLKSYPVDYDLSGKLLVDV